jgi:asparagine synthase (glutamine-hydrolysing)
MCGIAGILTFGARSPGAFGALSSGDEVHGLRARVREMARALDHRGPDALGVWADAGVALGHTRLAIVELSEAGAQPMASACGRFVLSFNGEIYNHRELRRQLEQAGQPPTWRGHSDTETLLVCLQAWGVTRTLQSAVGMFAFALWDRADRRLTLARDRMGEKPLYYGLYGETLLFGSEPKALLAHPECDRATDWASVDRYLRRDCVTGEQAIFKGMRRLSPGHALTIEANESPGQGLPASRAYWSVLQASLEAGARPFRGSLNDAADELDALLRQAIREQVVADVPVGAFLSGGIDSSTIVALMRANTAADVTTFSIGMPDRTIDESAHAKAVAEHLGTQHVAHQITPDEALELIPDLARHWDEPFADSSQIPTLLVSRFARRQVTVALTGDGADELFMGYTHHEGLARMWHQRSWGRLPWGAAAALLRPWPSHALKRQSARIAYAAQAWRQPSPAHLCQLWADRYRMDQTPLRLDRSESDGLDESQLAGMASAGAGALRPLGLHDLLNFLPNDILTKVDRASMAVSLETRAPFLDHRIVEFSLGLPEPFLLNEGVGKLVLRKVLDRYVPRSLTDRPKQGFVIPLSSWMRGRLRPWCESRLDILRAMPERFDRPRIDRMWATLLQGDEWLTHRIWALVMLAEFLARDRQPVRT